MVKAQFMKQLEEALNGQVPSAVVYDNIKYCNNYISNEIQKGRTESEIMEELGNPRLIARTIIDLYKSQNEDYYQSNSQHNESKNEKYKYQYNSNSFGGQGPRIWNFNFNSLLAKVLAWIVIVLFIVFAVWLLTGIASLLIVYAVPILMIIFFFHIIKTLFNRR